MDTVVVSFFITYMDLSFFNTLFNLININGYNDIIKISILVLLTCSITLNSNYFAHVMLMMLILTKNIGMDYSNVIFVGGGTLLCIFIVFKEYGIERIGNFISSTSNAIRLGIHDMASADAVMDTVRSRYAEDRTNEIVTEKLRNSLSADYGNIDPKLALEIEKQQNLLSGKIIGGNLSVKDLKRRSNRVNRQIDSMAPNVMRKEKPYGFWTNLNKYDYRDPEDELSNYNTRMRPRFIPNKQIPYNTMKDIVKSINPMSEREYRLIRLRNLFSDKLKAQKMKLNILKIQKENALNKLKRNDKRRKMVM